MNCIILKLLLGFGAYDGNALLPFCGYCGLALEETYFEEKKRFSYIFFLLFIFNKIT